jgi:hypothetical protein
MIFNKKSQNALIWLWFVLGIAIIGHISGINQLVIAFIGGLMGAILWTHLQNKGE